MLKVLAVLAGGWIWGQLAQGEDHPVRASGLAEVTAVEPGGRFWVATELEMREGWHVYWINPGDSGLPPETKWEVPEGVEVGPVQWPYPHRFQVGPLVSLGYEGRVLLMQEVRVPPTAELGSELVLRGEVSWLVCKEVCLPGEAQIEVRVPIRAGGGEPDPALVDAFARTREGWPVPLPSGVVRARVEDRVLMLRVETRPGEGQPIFFPLAEGLVRLAEAQGFTGTDGGFELRVPLDRVEAAQGRVAGVLVNEKGFPGFGGRKALYFEADVGAGSGGMGEAGLGWGAAVLFAVVGGVLLNLMPCVFPILSLKVMGFLQHAREDPGLLRWHGLLFGAGVVGSFWILAGLLLVLRAGGEQLGWGFQLQSPGFVAFLAMLFFGIGLSLAGVFEVGTSLMRLGEATGSGRNRSVEALLSGALATVVATPCTAPLMGPALGAALAMPAWQAFLVFTGLGMGMAGPYVLLSFQPNLAALLPKPGAWMESLKQFMAFPMFGTVIWLGWVFGLQRGLGGVVDLLTGLLLLGLAGWIWGRWNTPARTSRVRLVALVLSGMFAGLAVIWAARAAGHESPQASNGIGADRWGIEWIPFSQETVDRLVEEGRIIYIDFTAAWCVTCQVNKRVVFGSEEVRRKFRELNVAAVRGDWTKKEPVITEALRRYGRAGVPLNVVYGPKKPGEATILPEFPLTPEEVLRALEGAR